MVSEIRCRDHASEHTLVIFHDTNRYLAALLTFAITMMPLNKTVYRESIRPREIKYCSFEDAGQVTYATIEKNHDLYGLQYHSKS